MTEFGDMLFQFGGVPVGGLPIQLNANYTRDETRYYWVDGTVGSDGFDGRTPKTPKATIAAAITLMNANILWSNSPWAPRNVLIIAPGTYAENLTALPYGAVVYGLGHDTRDAQLGVKIKPASGNAVNVSSVIDSAFYNIGFETHASGYALRADSLHDCYFENCFFTGPAESVTAAAAFRTSDTVKTTFRHCWFANAAKGMQFEYADGGDSVSYLLVEDSVISHATDGIYVSTNLVGPHSIIRNTDIFAGGATMNHGVDDNSGILQLSNLNITATDPVEGCRAANGCYGNGALLGTTGE